MPRERGGREGIGGKEEIIMVNKLTNMKRETTHTRILKTQKKKLKIEASKQGITLLELLTKIIEREL